VTGPPLRTDLVTIFRLRAFVPREISERVRENLRGLEGVRHVLVSIDPGHDPVLITADVEPGAADTVLEAVREIGIPADDLSLSRDEKITLGSASPLGEAQLAWAAVLGEARAYSRLLGRYLVLMAAAGLIAAFGVIDRNEILIVGAMAVSPDLLPLCAACVGIQARRPQLVGRALGTLLFGLGIAFAAAVVLTVILDATNWLPADFDVRGGAIGTLARIDLSTIVVAAAAGVAAILAFETRASAAVGVAISVTTIPAAAYAGVAGGLGEIGDGLHGLAVLAINVSVLLVAGTLTLVGQRLQARRRSRPAGALR
jgi:uncharacterized hydrophobic protein (TIGR00271 family)